MKYAVALIVVEAVFVGLIWLLRRWVLAGRNRFLLVLPVTGLAAGVLAAIPPTFAQTSDVGYVVALIVLIATACGFTIEMALTSGRQQRENAERVRQG